MPLALDEVGSILRDRIDVVVVAAFAVFIGIIRLPYLGYLSLWQDEPISVLAAEGILKYGYPVLPSGRVYWSHGVLFCYLMSLFFMIFGMSEFSARIGSLIFGILALPLIYLLGKELGNKWAGAIGMLIVAFSPWAVTWARTARMYTQFQFFYLLTVYVFYKGYVAEDRPKNLLKTRILLIISILCAILSHFLALTLAPILILFVYVLVADARRISSRKLVIGGILGSIIVLGSLYFMFFFVVRPMFPEFSFSLDWVRYKLLLTRENLLLSYNVFYARYPVLSALFIMGLSVLISKRDKKLLYLYALFLISLHLVPILIATPLIGRKVQERFLFFLLPIFVLASSFSLLHHVDGVSDVIVEKLGEIRKHLTAGKLRKLKTWMILSIVIFPVISNLYVQILVPYSNTSITEAFSYYQPGHRNPWIEYHIRYKLRYGGVRGACNFIEQNYENGDAIIVDNQFADNQSRYTRTVYLAVYYYLQEIISERNVSLLLLYHTAREGRDFYLNSSIINTQTSGVMNEFDEILHQYDRVWIITDGRLVNSSTNQHEIIDFILENSQLVHVDAEERVQVYLWP